MKSYIDGVAFAKRKYGKRIRELEKEIEKLKIEIDYYSKRIRCPRCGWVHGYYRKTDKNHRCAHCGFVWNNAEALRGEANIGDPRASIALNDRKCQE